MNHLLSGADRRLLWLARGVLLIAVLAVGARSFGFQYVEFDDHRMVYANPHIQNLDWAKLRWMFTEISYNNHFYSPLLWLLYALSGIAVGFAPQAQHVVSVLIHMGGAWLVFEIIRLIVADPRPNADKNAVREIYAPLFGALFWALHPLRVEAYGWIAARVHLHAAFFALLSCWAFCKASRSTQNGARLFKRGHYWIAITAYALSILSFPNAASLPLAFGILNGYVLRSHQERKGFQRLIAIVVELIPFFIVAAIPVAISFFGNSATTHTDTPMLPPLGFWTRAMADCYVLWRYIAATLIPVDLAPIYTQLLDVTAASPLLIASTIMVAAIFAITFCLRKKIPALWGGWLCYIAMLLPFFALPNLPMFISDRYCYLAAVVWSCGLSWGTIWLWEHRTQTYRRMMTATAASILAVLGVASAAQLGIWSDSFTFFHALMGRVGNHYYRADPMWRLGMSYYNAGDLESALHWVRQSKTVYRMPAEEIAELMILSRRCQAAEKSDADDGAIATCYADMLEFCMDARFPENQPDINRLLVQVYPRLAQKLSSMNLPPQVISSRPEMARLIRIKALAALGRAQIIEQRNDRIATETAYNEAFADCRQAFDLSHDATICEAFGTVAMKLSRWDDAASAFEAEAAAAPQSIQPRLRLAQVRYTQGRHAEAEILLDEMIHRWPESREQAEALRNQWQATTQKQR